MLLGKCVNHLTASQGTKWSLFLSSTHFTNAFFIITITEDQALDLFWLKEERASPSFT